MKSTQFGLVGALALGAAVVPAAEPKAEGQPPSSVDGAHPASMLTNAQFTILKRILAPFRPDRLNAEEVRAIRSAMDSAGLKSGPALDAALEREGFSRKRMEELLPSQARAAEGAASPGAGRIPRRQ